MHAVESLTSAQFHVMAFHNNSQLQVATDSKVTTVGRSLREDMLWLRDFYSEMPDGALVDCCWSSHYLKAVRLLSCPQERANGIYFWQCFENPCLAENNGTISKKSSQDMLSQYVPEHHDGRTPLQLLAVSLVYGSL